MTYQIHSKPSNTGKRTVYFATVNGMRLSRTNFARKWEAERVAKDYLRNKAV